MKTKFILIYMIITGLAICGSAQARPSLTSMDEKLDQLLAGQEAIRADIEALREALGVNLAKCSDIEFSGTIWGRSVKGVDLRSFTNSTLHFIGCGESLGCSPAQFFCSFDQANLTLTFGAPSGVVRALVDPGNAAGASMVGGLFQCASSGVPDGIHNAPDKAEDAVALCRALGYQTGTVQAVNSNACPEASALDAQGQDWSSDFVASSGYGQAFTCSGVP